MESKNLIIAFTWIFVLVSVVVNSWQGNELTFGGYMIFFFMALAATIAVGVMMPDAQPVRRARAQLDS
jgi:hypothetical protein